MIRRSWLKTRCDHAADAATDLAVPAIGSVIGALAAGMTSAELIAIAAFAGTAAAAVTAANSRSLSAESVYRPTG